MMSDDMLSQDEIDALLRGAAGDSDETESYNEAFFQTEDYLSHMEQDALGEIGNISFGSSATALSTLLNQKVDITTPAVSVVLRQKLAEEFPHPYVAIQVNYTEGFFGSNLLVIQQSDAAIIADLMLGGDGTNPAELMGEIQLSAVQEAMNQMMGSAATSMSTIFGKKVDISPPAIDILDLPQGEGADRVPADDMLIRISFRLKIGSLIDSNIMQLLPLEFGKSLVNELLNPGQDLPAVSAVSEEKPSAQGQPDFQESHLSFDKKTEVHSGGFDQPYTQTGYSGEQPAYSQPVMNQASNPQSYIPAQNQAQQSGPQHFGGSYSNGVQPNVQPAAFSSFEPYHMQEHETKNLDMLLDIPLQVTVELGRTKRSVKEILELSSGSIIELDKLAGEPVDILVNNRLIAQGEVVVIDENFGVRVTDIISQSDRIKKLR
ncbi:flagellar motor switch phosphatase FliY [Bacillus sp. CMF12]|uniref:flagellar motor switch phosphatase FliY n=1 Tax=Bacillaceae TaxID=186817 RepID=UPI001FB2120B|nr:MULTISPECIES: flagellar motor switch phosphatase FliY [Bacillaceae]UOE57166.1 flagellar motor switch phosphatase FliY [Cytobacillus oceanisediminis]USK51658.1 flagellar motor switch phosphatase FliY [Bacillus sp. CMF12]